MQQTKHRNAAYKVRQDFGALAAVGVGRSAYLDAYFKNINWGVVEERMKNALTRHSDR